MCGIGVSPCYYIIAVNLPRWVYELSCPLAGNLNVTFVDSLTLTEPGRPNGFPAISAAFHNTLKHSFFNSYLELHKNRCLKGRKPKPKVQSGDGVLGCRRHYCLFILGKRRKLASMVHSEVPAAANASLGMEKPWEYMYMQIVQMWLVLLHKLALYKCTTSFKTAMNYTLKSPGLQRLKCYKTREKNYN